MIYIYVDGGGIPNSKYAYVIAKTGESKVYYKDGLTNNQAEYSAVLQLFLDNLIEDGKEYTINSDSQTTVKGLSKVNTVRNLKLKEIAIQIWNYISEKPNAKIKFNWIPRETNKAGQLLEKLK